MYGSDSITTCDHCQDQFDIGDIYDIDGEQLCEGCKDLGWITNPRGNPPPESELVRVRLCSCWGETYQTAKKVKYIKPPHKSMKKGCWRWLLEDNTKLGDQAVIAWKPLPTITPTG